MRQRRVRHTYEACLEEAKKHKTIAEWARAHYQTYHKAYRKEWLDKILEEAGISRLRVKKNTYSFEILLKTAQQYSSGAEWVQKDFPSYNWAIKHYFYKELKKLFKKEWTFEECLEEAKQYSNSRDWRKNGKTYKFAKKNNLFLQINEVVGFKENGTGKKWWYNI